MIGTEIRTLRQLKRLAEKSETGIRFMTVGCKGDIMTDGFVFPCEDEHVREGEIRRWGVLYLVSNYSTLRQRGYGYSLSDLAEKVNNGKKHIKKKYHKEIDELVQKNYTPVFFISHLLENEQIIGRIRYAMPDDFDEQYKKFITENKKVTDTVFSKYLPPQDPKSYMLFAATDGNPSFFAWAAKAVMQYRISLHTIMHLLAFNNECSSLVKRLSKKNIIALTSPKDIVDGLWESFHLRAEMSANKVISMFNPKQKHLLKEKLNDTNAIFLLNNFNRLSMKKKTNFIRKVSTIDNVDEILHLMSFVCSNTYFDWDQKAFHEFLSNVEGLDCEVIYEKDNITVLQVNNFETVKRLGKMTNWCISKNKSYWENYVGSQPRPAHAIGGFVDPAMFGGSSRSRNDDDSERSLFDEDMTDEKSIAFKKLMEEDDQSGVKKNPNRQFMLFDFNKSEDDKLSIVGVTANKQNGITNAHNFVNDNMLHSSSPHGIGLNAWIFTLAEGAEIEEEIKENPRCIYSYIKLRGIDQNLFRNYQYTRFEWNKANLFNHLNKFMDDEDYDIIFEDDKKLLLRSDNYRFAALMNNYSDFRRGLHRFTSDSSGKRLPMYWFFNFDETNENYPKLCFYFIMDSGAIEVATEPIDEFGHFIDRESPSYKDFTDLILELGLPFDIIRRPDTIGARIEHYRRHSNYDKIIELLIENEGYEPTQDFQMSFSNYASSLVSGEKNFEFFNRLKKVPYGLKDLFGKNGTRDILRRCIDRATSNLSMEERGKYHFFENEEEVCNYVLELNKKFEALPRRNNAPFSSLHENLINLASGNVNLFLALQLMERLYAEGDSNIVAVVLSAMVRGFEQTMYRYMNNNNKHGSYEKLFLNDIISKYIDRWNVIDLKIITSLFSIAAQHPNMESIVENRLDLFLDSCSSKSKTSFALVNKLINVATNNKVSSETFLKQLGMVIKKIREKEMLNATEMEELRKSIKEKVCAS